ncbi:MAG: hypothetical protein RMJ55_08005 [Roseiflexaceae bacterium]|nr:hypothetical protein [Roseiflexus sp.]MDW8213484.1 hypothetical protein [Roseiflexaceae bacterium]
MPRKQRQILIEIGDGAVQRCCRDALIGGVEFARLRFAPCCQAVDGNEELVFAL